jgi:hypothetical protein
VTSRLRKTIARKFRRAGHARIKDMPTRRWVSRARIVPNRPI